MKAFAIALLFVSSVVYAAPCTTTFITINGKTVVCTACPDTNTVICN